MRIIRLGLLIGAIVAAYVAYEQYEVGAQTLARRETESRELMDLLVTIQRLSSAPEGPSLKPRDQALEDLLAQLIDDANLLGSSVRLDLEGGRILWQPLEHGVEKATISLSSAAEADAALSYFAILWQLIQQQPVRVVNAVISPRGEVATLRVTLELFALAPV